MRHNKPGYPSPYNVIKQQEVTWIAHGETIRTVSEVVIGKFKIYTNVPTYTDLRHPYFSGCTNPCTPIGLWSGIGPSVTVLYPDLKGKSTKPLLAQ